MSSDSPSVPRVPAFRFKPGQEEDARAFLRQPSAYPRLKMIPNQRLRFGLAFIFIIPFVTFVVFPYAHPDSPDTLLVSVIVTVAAFVAIGGLAAGVAIKQGWFILDPEAAIMRYRKRDHPFATIGLPRLGKATVLERSGESLEIVSEMKYDVLVLGEKTVGGETYRKLIFYYDAMPRKKLEKIANLLNGMLQEYHEKEAVRLWLAYRDSLDAGHARGKPK